MQKTLGELTRMVGGELVGDADVVITGVAGVREASPGDITFAVSVKYCEWLASTRASAAIVRPHVETPNGLALVRVDNPAAAFAKIADAFAPPPVKLERGIHPSALIAGSAVLGEDVAVGPHVVIESGAVIGGGTMIRALSYVGHDVRIGRDCMIHPNVTLHERVSLGDRCIVHSGVVIGADGFGYNPGPDGRPVKIPQRGTVVIEDDVEIGANTTIDRARFDRTWIKRGTKIDNLCQIGHNCVIGENSLIVAMVGLCGSAHIGDHCVLAGKAAVNGHVVIGDRVMVGGLAGVTHDVPDDSRISGFPAQDHRDQLKLTAMLRRVPEMMRTLKELEKRIRELERGTDNDR